MVSRYETRHYHRFAPISIDLLRMQQVLLQQSSVETVVQLPCPLTGNSVQPMILHLLTYNWKRRVKLP